MAKARVSAWVLAGCLAVSGTSSGWAAPPVSQMLTFRPRQQGVVMSTPTAQEQESCKVELVQGREGGSGWVLKDPRGQMLRRFFATPGARKPDVWSYYLDGVEVYRETDTNA